MTGVTYQKKAKRWIVRATIDGIRKCLGCFKTEIEAEQCLKQYRNRMSWSPADCSVDEKNQILNMMKCLLGTTKGGSVCIESKNWQKLHSSRAFVPGLGEVEILLTVK
jgi:hypothetical protein